MAKLPTIQVAQQSAFYLRPDGASGATAIVYLPSFNDYVRNAWQRKGLELLSQASGDFSEKGENALRIGPPTDETIDVTVAAITGRVKGEAQHLRAEIEQTETFLADKLMDADERKLYQIKRRQLEQLYKDVDKGVPSVAELKRFFYREHRARLAQSIPGNIRGAVAAMAEEQVWAQREEEQSVLVSATAEE